MYLKTIANEEMGLGSKEIFEPGKMTASDIEIMCRRTGLVSKEVSALAMRAQQRTDFEFYVVRWEQDFTCIYCTLPENTHDVWEIRGVIDNIAQPNAILHEATLGNNTWIKNQYYVFAGIEYVI